MAENGDTRGLTLRELVLEMREDLKKVQNDHEMRMRNLERWRYGIPASILIALATAVAIVLRAFEV